MTVFSKKTVIFDSVESVYELEEVPSLSSSVEARVRRIPHHNAETKRHLKSAAESINCALEEQKDAVRLFRSTVQELRQEISILLESTKRYQSSLRKIDVEPLHTRAKYLATIMDNQI